MIPTLGAASSSDMRGNLLIGNDPEDQQWLPEQLHCRAPVRLLQGSLWQVAAPRQVGRTGQDGCPRWKDGQGILYETWRWKATGHLIEGARNGAQR
eukprot:4981813-Pyramimonas_sp.AAC.2